MTYAFDYSPTEEEFVHAFCLLGRRKGGRRIVPALWLGIVLCVILLTVLIRRFDRLFASPTLTALSGAATILMLLVLALLAAAPSLRLRAARQTLAQNPAFEGPVHMEFDEAEFRHRTTYSSARYPWEKLFGWREDAKVVVVQPAPQLFFVVPHRVMEESASATLRAGLARTRQGRLDV